MAKKIDQIIGTRLRILRMREGLSQNDVAQRLGISFQQVQKYEKGANRLSASTIVALSKILDVPISEFFVDIEHSDNGVVFDISKTPFDDPRSIKLMQAYASIRDEKIKSQILEFTVLLSKASGGDDD